MTPRNHGDVGAGVNQERPVGFPIHNNEAMLCCCDGLDLWSIVSDLASGGKMRCVASLLMVVKMARWAAILCFDAISLVVEAHAGRRSRVEAS